MPMQYAASFCRELRSQRHMIGGQSVGGHCDQCRQGVALDKGPQHIDARLAKVFRNVHARPPGSSFQRMRCTLVLRKVACRVLTLQPDPPRPTLLATPAAAKPYEQYV